MKKFILFLCLLFTATFLVGCFEKAPATVSSIEVTGNQASFDENFKLSDLSVTVKMSDGTSSSVALQEDMISPTDLAKFSQTGTHTINVTYLSAATSFTITITGEKGEKGDNGREVTFQFANEYIQWKYVGDATWNNLIAKSELKGLAGIDGTNGKEVTFQVTTEHVQWKYVGEATWKNLISLDSLKGPAGPAGPQGSNGKEITLQVADGFIQWKYVGDATWNNLIALSELVISKEVIFQVAEGYIQWKYTSDTTWTNLISVTDLTGPQGTNGKEVTFQVADGFIQWKYVGDATWNNLILIEDLIGEVQTPNITISDDGYWVINGVKTDKKAIAVVSTYTVTFNLNGGVMPDGYSDVVNDIEKGDSIDLPIPVREGFIFKGWFTGDTVNDAQFTVLSVVNRNLTLYAKWELDYSLLHSFFNTFKSTNFSMKALVSMSATIDELNETGEFEFIYKVSESEGIIHFYTLFNEEFTDDGELKSYTDETFIMYVYGMAYLLSLSDNHNYLEYWEDDYRFPLDLSLIDFSKFTKRSDAFIYDYDLDADILKLLGLEFDEDSNLELAIYLDLSTYTIHLEFSFDGEMDKTFAHYQITASLMLFDIGTTMVEYPIETAKTEFLSKVDKIVEERSWEFDSSTDDSVMQFQNLALSIKVAINDCLTYSDIIDAYYKIDSLYQYNFIYDDLKSHKNNKINDLSFLLDDLSKTATDASIVNMTDKFDVYVQLINSATSYPDIDFYWSEGKTQINNAFIEDEEKATLIDEINYKTSYLYMITNTVDGMLLNDEDSDNLWDIYYQYSHLLEKATSITQLNTAFEEAILAFKNANFELIEGALSTRKATMALSLNRQFLNVTDYIEEFSYDTYLELELCLDLLDEQDNIYDLIIIYNIIRPDFFETLTELVRQKEISSLNLVYNKHLFILLSHDDQIDDLNHTYNVFLANIQNNSFDGIYYQAYFFEQSLFDFPINNVKNQIYLARNQLIRMFDNASKNATDESIIEMNTALQNGLIQIDSSTTENQAWSAYELAEQAIFDAFVFDLQKVELQILKQQAFDEMLILTQYLGFYLNQSETNILTLHFRLYFDYYIVNATSTSEVNLLFDEWKTGINDLNLNYDLSILPDIKTNQVLPQLQLMYNEYIIKYGTLDTAETIYQNYVNLITNSNDIFEIYDLFFACLELIGSEYFSLEQIDALNDLEETYNYYFEIVIDDELDALLLKYNYYQDIINNAETKQDLHDAIIQFSNYCDFLTVDSLKNEKISRINSLRYESEYYKSDATDDSIIAIDAVVESYILLIKACTSLENVYSTYYDAIDEIERVYVRDDDKFLLMERIYLRWNQMYDFTIFVCNNAYDNQKTQELWVLYDTHTQILQQATTIDDADSVFQTWLTQFMSVNVDFMWYQFDYVKTSKQAQLIDLFSNTFNFYESIPTSLTDDFNQYLLDIKNASTFYQVFLLSMECEQLIYDNEFILMKDHFLVLASDLYQEYLVIIISSQIDLLDDLYADFLTKMNNALIIFDLYDAYGDFEYSVYDLTLDPLLEYKETCIWNFTNYYNDLKMTATSTSLTAMETIYQNFLAALDLCLSTEDMDTEYDNYRDLLDEAYVEDPEKISLYFYKEMIGGMLFEFMGFVEEYNEDLAMSDYANSIYQSYLTLLANAQTIDDAILVFNLAFSELKMLPYDFDPTITDSIKDDIIDEISTILPYFFDMFISIPPYLVLTYYHFESNIKYEMNPFIVMSTTYTFVLGLYINSTPALKLQLQNDMNEKYEHYLDIIDEGEIDDLSDDYSYYSNEFQKSADIYTMISLYESFLRALDSYTIISLKQYQQDTIDDMLKEFDYYSKTATDESYDLLCGTLDTYINLVYNASDEDSIDNAYDGFITTIETIYVINFSKFNNYNGIKNFSILLDDLCNFVDDYVDRGIDYVLIDSSLSHYQRIIMDSSSIVEASSFYVEAYSLLQTNLLISDSMFNQCKVDTIGYINNEYLSITDPSSDLTTQYNNSLLGIQNANSIFEIYDQNTYFNVELERFNLSS